MSEQNIVRHYRGETRSEAEQAYRSDALKAARAGYIAVDQTWTEDEQGYLLAVTFSGPDADETEAPAAASQDPGHRPSLQPPAAAEPDATEAPAAEATADAEPAAAEAHDEPELTAESQAPDAEAATVDVPEASATASDTDRSPRRQPRRPNSPSTR